MDAMHGLFAEHTATITRLAPDKSSPQWVHVMVGRKRAAKIPAAKVESLGLAAGVAWTESLIQRATLAAEVFRAKLKALSLLKVRGRSRAELAARLDRSGFSSAATQEALADLTRQRLLDDAALAREMASAALKKGLSASALQRRLRGAGIAEAEAASAVSESSGGDELSNAITQARNRAARLSESLGAQVRFRRVLAALARLGYEEDVARQAAAAALGITDDETWRRPA
jgi:SOS response regulatory protein OraA/RecX